MEVVKSVNGVHSTVDCTNLLFISFIWFVVLFGEFGFFFATLNRRADEFGEHITNETELYTKTQHMITLNGKQVAYIFIVGVDSEFR